MAEKTFSVNAFKETSEEEALGFASKKEMKTFTTKKFDLYNVPFFDFDDFKKQFNRVNLGYKDSAGAYFIPGFDKKDSSWKELFE